MAFGRFAPLSGYNISCSILLLISKHERMTTIMCAIQCSQFDSCRSYFHNSITNHCQFHTEVFLSNIGAAAESNTEYFYRHRDGQLAPTSSATTSSTTPAPARCPTERGFQMLGEDDDEMCVKFHTDRKTWCEAKRFCTSYSPNGHLIVVNTKNKNNLIRNHGLSIDLNFTTALFIGLTLKGGWVDGSPKTYMNWKTPRLKAGSTECAVYVRYRHWLWDGDPCDSPRHYICQVSLQKR